MFYLEKAVKHGGYTRRKGMIKKKKISSKGSNKEEGGRTEKIKLE